jgi:single-stranded DNA-binding protein
MAIDCALHGFCAADAEVRVSQAGKRWARLRVGVGEGDALQWVSIAVFGNAVEVAAQLKKADRIYCEGTIKLNSWRGNDGVERHGLAVTSFKVEQTHRIGRNKKRASGHQSTRQAQAPTTDLNDDIPF